VTFTITARYDAGNWQTHGNKSRKKWKLHPCAQELVNSSGIDEQADDSSHKTQQNQLFIYFCTPSGTEKKLEQNINLRMR